jgi:hypothetical protein
LSDTDKNKENSATVEQSTCSTYDVNSIIWSCSGNSETLSLQVLSKSSASSESTNLLAARLAVHTAISGFCGYRKKKGNIEQLCLVGNMLVNLHQVRLKSIDWKAK